jgi:glycosyltransferase involved in cell wall biosynthesis
MNKKARILLWGTYDAAQPRIKILVEGIKDSNFDLDVINCDIWGKHSDKSLIKGFFSKFGIFLSLVSGYKKALGAYVFSGKHGKKYDYVLVAHPGLLDIFALYPFAKLRGERIIWDVFIPAYECIVEDRGLLSAQSLKARMLYRIEYTAARLADRIFLDTKAHARYFERRFKLPENSVGCVFVGAEECFFAPAIEKVETEPFEALFFGKFIPLQGVETIVEAARIIQEKGVDVRFKLVGHGQESDKIDAMLASYGLKNIEKVKWLDYVDLINAIKETDVCLGVFGKTEKAQNVIPNKVFQALAMNKPVITLDTPAIRELYEYGSFKNLLLVKDSSADSLAEAILSFKNTPFECMENIKTDYKLVGKQFVEFIGEQL